MGKSRIEDNEFVQVDDTDFNTVGDFVSAPDTDMNTLDSEFVEVERTDVNKMPGAVKVDKIPTSLEELAANVTAFGQDIAPSVVGRGEQELVPGIVPVDIKTQLAELPKGAARGWQQTFHQSPYQLARWFIENQAHPGTEGRKFRIPGMQPLMEYALRKYAPTNRAIDFYDRFLQNMIHEAETITDLWNEQINTGWEAPSKEIMDATWGEAGLGKALGAGGQGIVSMAGAIGASVATGSPQLGLLMLSLQSGAGMYDKQRRRGKSIPLSNALAIANAAWEYGTEKIPFDYVFKGGVPALKRFLVQPSLEGIQEVVQGMGENILDYIGFDGKTDWHNIPAGIKELVTYMLNGWAENFFGGLIAGTGMAGAGAIIDTGPPTKEEIGMRKRQEIMNSGAEELAGVQEKFGVGKEAYEERQRIIRDKMKELKELDETEEAEFKREAGEAVGDYVYPVVPTPYGDVKNVKPAEFQATQESQLEQAVLSDFNDTFSDILDNVSKDKSAKSMKALLDKLDSYMLEYPEMREDFVKIVQDKAGKDLKPWVDKWTKTKKPTKPAAEGKEDDARDLLLYRGHDEKDSPFVSNKYTEKLGSSFTTDKAYAHTFAVEVPHKKGIVGVYKLKDDAKVWRVTRDEALAFEDMTESVRDDLEKQAGRPLDVWEHPHMLVETARKRGYDAIDMRDAYPGEKEIRLLNPKALTQPSLDFVKNYEEKEGHKVLLAERTDAAGVHIPFEEINSDNPYLKEDFPLERIKEDAANGVKLAQDALYELGEIEVNPITATQKKRLAKAQRVHGLSSKGLSVLSNYRTGIDNVNNLTEDEASDLINFLETFSFTDAGAQEALGSMEDPAYLDYGMPPKFAKRLMKISRTTKNFNRLVGYAKAMGGFPSNKNIPDLAGRQKSFSKTMMSVARKMGRHARAVKRKGEGKVNVLNPWSSMRYTYGEAEIKTGNLMRRLWSDMTYDRNYEMKVNEESLRRVALDAGVGMSYLSNPTVSKQVARWLSEEDDFVRDNLFATMSDKTQKVAQGLEDVLQTRGANLVRWARWLKWDAAAKKADEQLRKLNKRKKKVTKADIDKIMKPVKNAQPPNAPKEALQEGRDARDIGQLRGWIEAQTWGTRKRYFMSEKEAQSLVDLFPEGSIQEELFREAMGVGAIKEALLPELLTRKGDAKTLDVGNIGAAILNHLDAVSNFASTFDKINVFWNNFAKTNPSKRDISLARQAVNTLLGRHHFVEPYLEKARFYNRLAWRHYFAASPTRSARFMMRNLLQNVAFGLTQVDITELAKTMAETPFRKGLNSYSEMNKEMRDSFEKFFETRISQRRQMYRHFLLQGQGARATEMSSRAASFMDKLAQAAPLSDEINRMAIFPLIYRTSQRNLDLFSRGKISASQLDNRLEINTLHPSQQAELKRLLDEGKFVEFNNNYTEYKIENVHFRYETSLRSLSEQTPGGRMAMGLITFPRGVWEIMRRNGVEPMLEGAKNRDPKHFWKGLATLLTVFVGGYEADDIYYRITGKHAYDPVSIIFQYSPLGLGAGRIMDMFDAVKESMYRLEESGLKGQDYLSILESTAKNITAVFVNELELFIPFVHEYLNYYESANNVYGVKLFNRIEKYAKEEWFRQTGRRYRRAGRTEREALQHTLFGGAEKGSLPTEAAGNLYEE